MYLEIIKSAEQVVNVIFFFFYCRRSPVTAATTATVITATISNAVVYIGMHSIVYAMRKWK